MTNTLLEVLITEAGEKLMGIQFKQRSSQLEVIDESWKANMSKALHPSSWGKCARSLHGRAESHGLAEFQNCWEYQSCKTLGRNRSAHGSPDTVPCTGERKGSPSIPAACSSSHTGGNYLGWDHQFDKQEKELGVRWATPIVVRCHLR